MIKMSFSLKKVRLDSYQKNLSQLSQVVGKAAADVPVEAKDDRPAMFHSHVGGELQIKTWAGV